MFAQFYSARGDLLIWPLLGLGIFLASFVAVLVYVLIGLRDRGRRAELAALPLNDEGEAPR
jgi:hypothetical protein